MWSILRGLLLEMEYNNILVYNPKSKLLGLCYLWKSPWCSCIEVSTVTLNNASRGRVIAAIYLTHWPFEGDILWERTFSVLDHIYLGEWRSYPPTSSEIRLSFPMDCLDQENYHFRHRLNTDLFSQTWKISNNANMIKRIILKMIIICPL